MHLTLTKEATRPAGRNFPQQQAKFDQFIHCYDFERSHQALGMKYVFAAQKVGIKEVAEKIWLVSFMHYELGFFDEEFARVECAENPFGADVPSPMYPE